MKFYRYRDLCLCDCGGRIPREAAPEQEFFAPLVFVVNRPPQNSRGLFRVESLAQLGEAETVRLLLPHEDAEADELELFVRKNGASVLNTAFANCWSWLQTVMRAKRSGLRLNLVGLGDVGGTVLTGLKLLGREISEIGIFDTNSQMVKRYCIEMNQILPETEGGNTPKVFPVTMDRLFDCDCLLFTASLGVPAVGSSVRDVRMAQFARNRVMLRQYARQARDKYFGGLFCQISDPVDHLSRVVFMESNRDINGMFDGWGLLPEQVQGYGLGVMHARAFYHAQQMNIGFTEGAVFGPHGQELVVANALNDGYDEQTSAALTEATVTANHRVRELGFKPYLAPGLSSAVISILRTLRGEWHDGAVPFGGVYFGCESRLTAQGMELRRQSLHPSLLKRLEKAHKSLREFAYDG